MVPGEKVKFNIIRRIRRAGKAQNVTMIHEGQILKVSGGLVVIEGTTVPGKYTREVDKIAGC